MASNILSVMCFLLVLMQIADGSLVIDVNPTEIAPGLTRSLTVNCSFSFDGFPDLAGLTSLIIAKENQLEQYTDLVSINVFSPNVFTGADQVNGIVTGHIESDAESFLSIEWQFPALDEGGIYRCQVNGMNSLGHPVEQESQSVNVSAEKPSLDLLITKLSEVQRQLDLQELFMQNQSHTIDTLLSLVQAQSDKISSQTDIISQQTDTINKYTNTVTNMQNKIDFQNSLTKELGFHISPEYQGHYYLLSKQDFNNSTISEQTCEDFGGYLAEINDADEQVFVQEFLNSLVGFDNVLISGTEEGHEQSWTYTGSGGPLTYTNWYTNEPNNANYFCIIVMRANSWFWFDYPCVYTSTNHRFLCEGNIN